MCGIVAQFSRRNPVSASSLEHSTQSLYHRGPDGQRHWISSDGKVGLGHSRLSIIDLSTGDQPIASEDERTRIVVNGEFYGYEAIQRELVARGHKLRTRSDSEIALHLYEEYGTQCLHQLRGEFAFVLWDLNRRRIFAARDRFGIKPLFYAWHKETLYFASEVKALFAAGVPARWDEESVYNAVEMGSPMMRTLFDGVFQVPPGHFLIATDKHVQVNSYWDFDYPLAADNQPKLSDAEYKAAFREKLEESVRIRLRADVPVGVYLSGGLDSCAVLGLAAKHHPEPIRAFTLTFEQAAYDEGPIAKEMAALAGAEYTPVPIRQQDIADHFADAIAQAETLCVNAHGSRSTCCRVPYAMQAIRSCSPAKAPMRFLAAMRTSAVTCCSTTARAKIRTRSMSCSSGSTRATSSRADCYCPMARSATLTVSNAFLASSHRG
jgi:asparagine synthase (glutamine-hydrolysing)